MKIGIIFPGQGSQYLGMGKSFYDRERLVQELFEQASKCLDLNFVRLCFASSDKEMKETINAQTSIFLASAAIYTVLNKKYGIVPDLVAGHSSGEYSAVYAAGGMNFADVLYLLKKRASFMQEATKGNVGGMLAVIGLSLQELKIICNKYDRPESNDYVAEIVNYNSPKQFVVSGTLPELDQIKDEVKLLKGKAIELSVAGAFHSRLMKQVEKDFSAYLVKVDFKDLQVSLINNVESKIVKTSEEIKSSLVGQTSLPVLWWPSMEQFKEMDLIIEIGPGTKFSKILKREWPEKQIFSINELQDLHALLEKLGIPIQEEEIVEEEGEDLVEQELEAQAAQEEESELGPEVNTNKKTKVKPEKELESNL